MIHNEENNKTYSMQGSKWHIFNKTSEVRKKKRKQKNPVIDLSLHINGPIQTMQYYLQITVIYIKRNTFLTSAFKHLIRCGIREQKHQQTTNLILASGKSSVCFTWRNFIKYYEAPLSLLQAHFLSQVHPEKHKAKLTGWILIKRGISK